MDNIDNWAKKAVRGATALCLLQLQQTATVAIIAVIGTINQKVEAVLSSN